MEIQTLSNLESVGEMVGALVGIAEGLEEDSYVENLIREAHGEATSVFDLAAAATASAGHLQHVYEFGVAGVTAGKTKYPDPTSEAARLWQHKITGFGGRQDIAYTFRPALNRNPQPTTKSTGVPSKYLRKLSRRKYVFWNKAFVMETGAQVNIKAKNGDLLFVPFYGQGRDPRNKRGYMMWNSTRLGAISNTPGASTKGTFTAFWLRWWASEGEEVMEKSMRKSVERDIKKATSQIKTTAKMKPSAANRVNAAAKKGKTKAEERFGNG